MSSSRHRRSKQRRQKQHATPKCPTPRKLKFRDEQHATNVVAHLGYQGRDRRPQRAYKCPCGFWHVTAKARWN